MSSRVRKRSLDWRRPDPVGGGPKREIQITEHACSKSAVYPLWTGSSILPRFHTCKWPAFTRRAISVSGENFSRPGKHILDAATGRLASNPQLEVLRAVIGPLSVAMM